MRSRTPAHVFVYMLLECFKSCSIPGKSNIGGFDQRFLSTVRVTTRDLKGVESFVCTKEKEKKKVTGGRIMK